MGSEEGGARQLALLLHAEIEQGDGSLVLQDWINTRNTWGRFCCVHELDCQDTGEPSPCVSPDRSIALILGGQRLCEHGYPKYRCTPGETVVLLSQYGMCAMGLLPKDVELLPPYDDRVFNVLPWAAPTTLI